MSGTAKCQSATIAEQLTFGVRLLDIRCRHVHGQQAQGYHGEGFGLEVAEKEPVGPDAVEVLIEPAQLREMLVKITNPAILPIPVRSGTVRVPHPDVGI